LHASIRGARAGSRHRLKFPAASPGRAVLGYGNDTYQSPRRCRGNPAAWPGGQVTESDALADEVRRRAELLASRPPTATALSKRLLNQSQENSLLPMLEYEAMAQGLAVTDPEHRRAVEAFRQRRNSQAVNARLSSEGNVA
jgi:hypothetical protein